jgi:tetratricopeptide (TPR) repeat protein
MMIASPTKRASDLSPNEEALQKCHSALEQRDRGDYLSARKVMDPLWKGPGERPDIRGLHSSVAAEVLLCVGVLSSWIGSKEEFEHAQEIAKNLISEGIAYYEAAGDLRKVTEGRAEIAYCYFREGALNEARVMLTEALERLTTEGNTRARALLRLAIVECAAAKYDDASKILSANASLFGKIGNHAIVGAYHNQVAMVLRKLAVPETRLDYLQRAVSAYQKADHHFKLAHNVVFRAIEVAHQVGALNKAGLAALSLIEEIEELPGEVLHAAFHGASEWLAEAQSQDLLRRFTVAAEKVFAGLNRKLTAAEATEDLSNKPCDLQKEMLRHEGLLIKEALSKTNGRLTEAAAQLNMSYQALAYILEGRHKDLLKDRSPIRRRARRVEN